MFIATGLQKVGEKKPLRVNMCVHMSFDYRYIYTNPIRLRTSDISNQNTFPWGLQHCDRHFSLLFFCHLNLYWQPENLR